MPSPLALPLLLSLLSLLSLSLPLSLLLLLLLLLLSPSGMRCGNRAAQAGVNWWSGGGSSILFLRCTGSAAAARVSGCGVLCV